MIHAQFAVYAHGNKEVTSTGYNLNLTMNYDKMIFLICFLLLVLFLQY